jgi:hypothetical protein
MAASCLVLASLGLCACKKEEPTVQSVLQEAAGQLETTRFGDDFDQALAVIQPLTAQKQDLKTAYQARLVQAVAHLNLFMAAVITEEEVHYAKVKKVLGWELERELLHIRNFQVLVQDILEQFRLIEREAKEFPELQKQATALAAFTHGLQSVFYRDKERYFEGRLAVLGFEQYRYLDDLASVRDLVFEVTRRTATPGANWRNIVLTVFGRICPTAASQAIVKGCVPADPMKAPEHCPADQAQLASAAWADAALALGSCRDSNDQDGPAGLDAIRAHYDLAYNNILASEKTLSPVFVETIKSQRQEMDDAFQELEKLLQ